MIYYTRCYEGGSKYLCNWSGIGIKGDSISESIILLQLTSSNN